MADLERQAGIIYTPIIIDMGLEQIPETAFCICNEPAQRAFVPFEARYTLSGRPAIARCDLVPGYRCGSDDLEFYDLGVSVRVLSAALDIIRGAGDTTAAEQVSASLNVGQQQLSEINSTPGV